MDTVTRLPSLLPRARASSAHLPVATGAAQAASEHVSLTPPTPVGRRTANSVAAIWSEVAGGAVGIVAAGGFGSDRVRGTGPQDPISWRSQAIQGVHGLSGRTGRRVRDRVRQNRSDLGNVPTPECECMSMYGIEGRVVPGATTVAGYSVSSARMSPLLREGLGAGEPARGVMGGLLQPTTPSVEPPVSSLNGFSRTPTTTAPAPIDVLAGEVSPQASAVRAAVSVEPAGR